MNEEEWIKEGKRLFYEELDPYVQKKLKEQAKQTKNDFRIIVNCMYNDKMITKKGFDKLKKFLENE